MTHQDYDLLARAFRPDVERYFSEDDLAKNFYYLSRLPNDVVECKLYFKSDILISGMPFFVECFKYLGCDDDSLIDLMSWEGKWVSCESKTSLLFNLPFGVALTAERIALNILQHLSGISTLTHRYVERAKDFGIQILDTRKTLPGLRSLQKYAVRVGGGSNHRFSQTEMWMVKDNHKNFFGGLSEAVDFFTKIGAHYAPVIVEIHSLTELKQAMEKNIRYLLLDNFSSELLYEAIKMKKEGVFFELSGGITLDNLDQYLVEGVDAISVGQLTSGISRADISLKYNRCVQ